MDAVEILSRFKELGVSVRLDGDKVRVAPVSKVPGDLLAEAKAHKAEIVKELKPTSGDSELPPLDHPPENEMELRRLMDALADPEYFSQWLERVMAGRDPAEPVA